MHEGSGPAGRVVLTHSKEATCSNCPWCPPHPKMRVPWCFCLPYLETRDADGELLGTTKYVCDACLFVPKYDVLDADGEAAYRIRPDVCCLGACVRFRCGGPNGNCWRIPSSWECSDRTEEHSTELEEIGTHGSVTPRPVFRTQYSVLQGILACQLRKARGILSGYPVSSPHVRPVEVSHPPAGASVSLHR